MRTITVQCRKIGEEAWGTLNHFTAEHTQISELIGDDAKESGYERLIAHARKTASNWMTNYPQEWQVRVVDSATVKASPVEPAPKRKAPRKPPLLEDLARKARAVIERADADDVVIDDGNVIDLLADNIPQVPLETFRDVLVVAGYGDRFRGAIAWEPNQPTTSWGQPI